jgi:fructose-1,6-bisphosphatase/inositol monophosphatase family enzyme
VAQGHADFVLSGQMTPWDHAPGALIVERAGGKAAMIDGTPYSAAVTSGYLIVASNKDTWSRVAEAFSILEDLPAS